MSRKILFVHQNFPGQFRHGAPALQRRGWDVKALRAGPTRTSHWQGVHTIGWQARQGTTQAAHPLAHDTETKLIRAEAAAIEAEKLAARGWEPELIVGHPGWGELLFLNTIWPNTPQLHYLEFHYASRGLDVGFDPEFAAPDWRKQASVIAKTGPSLINLSQMHQGLCPTHFQASTFPAWSQERISVIHDGIDTAVVRPNPEARFCPAPGGPTFKPGDPVLTFVSRNLEPYRGYHRLLRALPALQQACPQLHTVIVGGDGVSYGAAAPQGTSWKALFLDEVAGALDLNRVWFTGNLPYAQYLQLLQVSACHLYFTYPFVLSWSCLEAMAMGCAVVGSDTAPVQEVITAGEQGLLVDFFDQHALMAAVLELLTKPTLAKELGQRARERVLQHYDLQSICLPRQIELIESLAG